MLKCDYSENYQLHFAPSALNAKESMFGPPFPCVFNDIKFSKSEEGLWLLSYKILTILCKGKCSHMNTNFIEIKI